MMDGHIRKKVNHLASYITDRTAIVAHINRDHGTRYTLKDINAVIRDTFEKPKTGVVWTAPIVSPPPICTSRSGMDPLAVATNAYIARNANKIRDALTNAGS